MGVLSRIQTRHIRARHCIRRQCLSSCPRQPLSNPNLGQRDSDLGGSTTSATKSFAPQFTSAASTQGGRSPGPVESHRRSARISAAEWWITAMSQDEGRERSWNALGSRIFEGYVIVARKRRNMVLFERRSRSDCTLDGVWLVLTSAGRRKRPVARSNSPRAT